MFRPRLAVSTAFALVFVVTASMPALAAKDRVTIDTGDLQGVIADGVVSFKGIPYAQPPVGNNRWRAPQPAKKWQGVRKADEYGPDCMQIPFPGDAAPLGVPPKEDCLYINVWAPEKPSSEKLPVMVWIYGGGFVNGGSSPAVYDGSAFAKSDVVLVSMNYRIARFGFFAHPALTKEQGAKPTANFGLLDQVAALEWVKRNIVAFGGDASNVTIFGESAGGMSVNTLLTTPLAKGLVHKAIIQSGGGRPGMVGGRKLGGGPGSAESTGVDFAKSVGIEGEGAEALAKLRALSAEEIAKGLNMASMGGNNTYVGGPVEDGWVVLGAPTRLYAKGVGARVPVMVGATNMDIGFVAAKDFDELFAPFGDKAARAKQILNPGNSTHFGEVAFRVGGDQMMSEPARQVARALSARGQPVYYFRFSYVAESLRKQFAGAFHASDIPFAFDTVAARYGKDLTANDSAAAKAMHEYWVTFARTGQPTAKGHPDWPAYTAQNDAIMDFTTNGPVVGPDPWRERMDLAASVSDAKEQAASAQ
jgi:para-nitrobenzyl esterase